MPVTELYGFSEGLFFVQDEASQLCVEALEAERGMQVLDLCACPGSKSFGIALEMQNEGSLLACDLHANKLSLVRTGAERLGLSIIETSAADARNILPERVGAYDRVLCDVPCSGFGVLGKKPELRYKEMGQTERLAEIQQAILENACRYLKKGGRLIYSTCTLLERENDARVDAFLESHPEFEEAPLGISCGQDVSRLTLFPDVHGTDGFYIAAMVKRG
jgi:16S rRNA (cytosine967-C5)-methyltransferase